MFEVILLIGFSEIEISFKFTPKILMSKECINFFGPLCIYRVDVLTVVTVKVTLCRLLTTRSLV